MRRGATVRLFVAADLPGHVRGQLARWARASVGGREGLRCVPEAMLHVTLAFLGGCPAGELEAIAAATLDCGATAALAPGGAGGAVQLGAPLWLPPRRPRVLAIELHDGAGALAAMQRDVVTALATAIGYQPERRRFRPHVTVARLASRVRPGGRELPPTPAASFDPIALTLYRSTLHPDGAAYEPVATTALAAER